MRNDVKIKFDLSKLKGLQKQLMGKSEVRVGVLGSKTNRSDQNTNAGIGLAHEFGAIARRIPRRSFLRMPLEEKLTIEKIKGSGITKELVANKKISFLKKLGILAENIIQDAFDTGGFGSWQTLSQKTRDKKNSDRILIDTQQLRKSITSKVIDK